MASPDAGAAVTAAIFAYPKDAAERRTRVWYGLVFILSKSCALALTFIPPSNDSAQQLFALSIANLVFSFLLDACAKRESKRWAGEEGDGTHFYYCFLETILGSWITARFVGAIKNGWNRLTIMTREGSIHLAETSDVSVASTESKGVLSPLDEWAQDISWAYNSSMFVKKLIAAAIVAMRWYYDKHGEPRSLDLASRVLSSFTSLVLVDIIDGLAKEESRLRSKTERSSVVSRVMGWFA